MSAAGHPVERDQIADVARQHDTGRLQGEGTKRNKRKIRGIEPRTWQEHILGRVVS